VLSIDGLENDQVVMYPNPVRAGNQVQLNTEVTRIDLFDLSGKVISTFSNSAITTDGLSEGIYFVKAITRSGSVITKKLVIN
jgi:hypothetical protein